MQHDAVGRDRKIAFVGDRLAIDQSEGAQRRHGFVEAVAFERGRDRHAEFLPRLSKQK